MTAPGPAPAPALVRLAVLDGWRGCSILCVLAGHLLPLGPKAWSFNGMIATAGMAIFFTLSGFLITRFLLHHASVGEFLIRRICRVVPLVWAYSAVALAIVAAPPGVFAAQFLFYANLPPAQLSGMTAHLWSLCVEMQFYVGIALLVLMGGRRALYALPALCLAVTAYRVWDGAYISIYTYHRIDEILAGCILALAYEGQLGAFPPKLLQRLSPYLLLPLFLLSCHPDSGWANYPRPYLAALLVGSTLYRDRPALAAALASRPLRYIAEISYALYVFHPMLAESWLGAGDKAVKYLKRPLLFAALFLTAHLSTYYYERYWIALGKRATG